LRTDRAASVVAAIGDAAVVAPDLLGPEVLSTLRGLERGGKVTTARAEIALRRFERAPVQTIKTGNLLGRTWELRHNLSAYDACYVALAEILGARLITADRALAKAPALALPITVV
jgi:predicted nucleic acid-binding protein